ncbi:MAG: hypothetical protein JXA71_07735, partial [Chitinispirillaceae bacterium]|nr:hypothetical protein [Chitinispirillaceae bacterium]
TRHIPKALVPVCGKPLIDRALSFCVSHGMGAIGVNSHYLHERLEEHREGSAVPYTLFHEDGVIRGTGGGLFFAREFLAHDDLFFVCNVDILYRFDPGRIIRDFTAGDRLACLLATPAAGTGTIRYDRRDGNYRGLPIDGADTGSDEAADFIGAAVYRREFLDLLQPDDFSIVPVWARAAASGAGVGVPIVDSCYWRDVGTPSSLAAAHFDAIDNVYDPDLPECLHVDRGTKKCFHRDLPPFVVERLGPYSWVETPDLPLVARMERSIVLAGARVDPGAVIDRCLVTPFGEVSFGT